MELAQVPDRMFAKIFLTAVVITAGVRLAACEPHRTPSYYFADELIASGLRAHEGEILRVHGYVQAGSLGRLYGDDTLHRFQLERRGVGLQVEVSGMLPDTFRDQAEVIVTGRLVHHDGWMIEGTAMIAKCSSHYQGTPAKPGDAVKFQ
jgi:cytochrome c-type biogenesis protein CcmE